MAERDARIDRLLLRQEVADFLYREAELLDARRFRDWLDLLAEDIRYWMPMRRNVKFGEDEREFTRAGSDVNWFDEGKETLDRRVKQIETGIHWAEEPRSRLSHLVTNVQLGSIEPSASDPGRWPPPVVSLSIATASKPRPTSWSAGARMCCGATARAGLSRGARLFSIRTCCSRRT